MKTIFLLWFFNATLNLIYSRLTITKLIKDNYQKSISDWKNEYIDECEKCTKKVECGGFFSSAIKYGYSKHIRAFKNEVN